LQFDKFFSFHITFYYEIYRFHYWDIWNDFCCFLTKHANNLLITGVEYLELEALRTNSGEAASSNSDDLLFLICFLMLYGLFDQV
jgi:hypothetical protein